MKKIYYFILLYCSIIFTSFGGENKSVSFITITGPSLNFVKVEAHNTAYMNGMKIIGSRTLKQGNNWITVAKVIPKY
jgi:hypothetical protein